MGVFYPWVDSVMDSTLIIKEEMRETNTLCHFDSKPESVRLAFSLSRKG